MIFRGTGLLVFVGLRAASFAADMPNTYCACPSQTKRIALDERTGDYSLTYKLNSSVDNFLVCGGRA